MSSDIKMTDSKPTTTSPDEQMEGPIVEKGSIKMDILLNISSMQHQNGLRVNDFKRYSHFCKKKINKLRKFYKLTQGKRKFQKNEITSNKLTESKILLIPLLECERNWAYGMFHKQELTAIGEDIRRLRHQISRKLNRASLNAKKVYDLCKEVGDTQTELEGEAYYGLIAAEYLIFRRHFEKAFNLLRKTTAIYTKLSELKDSIEAMEYKEKINQIKTSIRLCLYNMSMERDDISYGDDDIDKAVAMEDKELNKKINEIKDEKSKETSNQNQQQQQYKINYHGKEYPIKNEKLKELFMQCNVMFNKFETEHEHNKKVILFKDYYNLTEEMVRIINKEKNEEINQQAENATQMYTSILNYIECLRINAYIKKNEALINDYSKDFEDEKILTSLCEKPNLKLRVRPQELIKLYDNLLDCYNKLIILDKENPDKQSIKTLTYYIQTYNLFKLYYSGIFLILHKRFPDTIALMNYFVNQLKANNEYYNQHHINKIDLYKKSQQYETLCGNVIKSSLHAIDKEKERKEKTTIDNKTKEQIMQSIPYVNELLEKEKENELPKEFFDIFGESIKMNYKEYKDGTNKQNQIIKQLIGTAVPPPKPIQFDLIYQQLNYPNLEAKMKKQEQQQSKGFLGRTFGYFWGSK